MHKGRTIGVSMAAAFALMATVSLAEVTSPTATRAQEAQSKTSTLALPAELQSLPPAADFALEDAHGKIRRLHDFKGRVVLVNFFASWCAPCFMEAPHLRELNRQYSPKGVTIIGISVDAGSNRALEAISKEWELEHLILRGDEKVASAYKVVGIPHTVILTPELKVYKTFMGYRSKSRIEAEITSLLKKLGPSVQ